jgi:hypothetical protein
MDIKELKRHLSAGKIEAHLRGVDFKRSWQQAHGKDISAIANDESITTGWIVVGVDDNGIVVSRRFIHNTKKIDPFF